MKGKLYIIPSVISEGKNSALAANTIDIIHSLRCFVAERARTARRFIKTTSPPYEISDLEIIEIDKNETIEPSQEVLAKLQSGIDVGMLSEAGCPGIADPGSMIVGEAQKEGYQVIPLVGPSSIFLALMASGMNGQSFSFVGYLPIKEHELKKSLAQIEQNVLRDNATQIFIETPYRNDRMMSNLLKYINGGIKLCIATDLTGDEENIQTKTIMQWKKSPIQIGKLPTVFLLGK